MRIMKSTLFKIIKNILIDFTRWNSQISIQSKDISVVVQGAVNREITPHSLASVRKYLPNAEIILSTWKNTDVSGLDYDKLVLNDDPGAVFEQEINAPNNINRQIVSTLNGLKASEKKYTLKFRSDILLTSKNFLKYYGKYEKRFSFLNILHKRILVCNKYTRKANCLCFHISDWVMFGETRDLIKIWDIPMALEPETTTWYHNHKLLPEHSFHVFRGFRKRYCTEQWIWMSFLNKYTQIEFSHMFDTNLRNIQLTEQSFANNVVILSEMQFGIHFIKYKTNDDFCYSYFDWCNLYKKYCDEEVKYSVWDYVLSDMKLYKKEHKKISRIMEASSKKTLVKFIIAFCYTLRFKFYLIISYWKNVKNFLNLIQNSEQTEKEKRSLAESKKHLISVLPNLSNILKKYEKSECLNIFLFQHLGDNFFRCAIYHELEKKYKKKVNFIIPKSQEILAKLWNIENYTLIDLNKEYFNNILGEFSSPVILEYFKEYCVVQAISSTPNIENSFIVYGSNDAFNRFLHHVNIDTMMKYIYASLGFFPKDTRIDVSSVDYSSLKNTFIAKLPHAIPLEKIIIVAPECNSDTMLDKNFWSFIVEKLTAKGYYIVENITNINNHIEGAHYIDLTIEEAVSLGMSCRAVFSLRSGFCDLLVGKKDNLFVVMSKKRYVEAGAFFGFQQNFKSKLYPCEIILDYKKRPQMFFEADDLLKDMPIKYFPGYKSIGENFLDSIFNKKYFGRVQENIEDVSKNTFYFLGIPVLKKCKSLKKKYIKVFNITLYNKRL